MSEQEPAPSVEKGEHSVLPFRLRDVEPLYSFSEIHPVAKSLDTLQVELKFKAKLALREWNKEYWATLVIGVLAFFLGSLSPEILDGGDATKIGIEGLNSISGIGYFQMLISIVLWGWFAMQIWRLFPVMRIHAISLLFFWNVTVFAQILFHETQIDFPVNASLGGMMEGSLAMLIVMFFVYYFGRAVVETRDYHIEEYHVHEDVRLTKMEMGEHSLRGWGLILTLWFVLITLSAWAGAHFVAERGGERMGALMTHLLSGGLSIPLFMMLIWYPQRMLGTDAQVQTRAAINAKMELDGKDGIQQAHEAQCPECETPVAISRNKDGQILLPCPTVDCSAKNLIGTTCKLCSVATPTRYECPNCGMNAPALDYISDVEAW
tara:strand:- start:16845 stop:17978 length:1134 start_codon:yes stop_codon:yes gene_type:complete